jgi:hypothetical protein
MAALWRAALSWRNKIPFESQRLISTPTYVYMSRDTSVGIPTAYGQDDRGSIPGGDKISLSIPLWGPRSLLSSRWRDFFPRGKAAGAWMVELYLHSPYSSRRGS